jgi:hypothetical protein
MLTYLFLHCQIVLVSPPNNLLLLLCGRDADRRLKIMNWSPPSIVWTQQTLSWSKSCHSPSSCMKDEGSSRPCEAQADVALVKLKRRWEHTVEDSRCQRSCIGGHIFVTKVGGQRRGSGRRSDGQIMRPGGHVSCPDSWGTKIFVNFKWL